VNCRHIQNKMDKSTYLIGEIGQNHNGSVEIAKSLIDIISEPIIDNLFGKELKPMDAVKMTKRDLKEEMADAELLKPYTGFNSFGKTYKEHREHLELSDEEHFETYKYAKSKGLDFIETLCAKGCMSMFNYFEPDKLKVASRDLTNLPLLEVLAETKRPIILSTGMGGKKEIDDALDIITKYHSDISILHCLSQYPSEYKNINLNTILYLQKNYSDYIIGYSDHSIGISIPIAAVAMGAKILEKHITLNRKMKGSDQKGSLGPDGIYRLVRDIRNLDKAMGKEEILISDSVKTAQFKLERSIASKRFIKVGEIISEKDIQMLSPGDGYKASEIGMVIGMRAKEDIEINKIIYKNMLTQ